MKEWAIKDYNFIEASMETPPCIPCEPSLRKVSPGFAITGGYFGDYVNP